MGGIGGGVDDVGEGWRWREWSGGTGQRASVFSRSISSTLCACVCVVTQKVVRTIGPLFSVTSCGLNSL